MYTTDVTQDSTDDELVEVGATDDTGHTVVEMAMVSVTSTTEADSAGQLVTVEAQDVTVFTVVV